MLSTNKWSFLTATVNSSGGYAIYVNGALDTSGTCGHPPQNVGSQTLLIGKSKDTANNVNYAGTMDDVRVYNRALTQGEVTQLYHLGTANAGHANTTAVSNGLVGYWPLDGSVTNWTTNTTADLSGNGRTGLLVSMSTSTSPVAGRIGQALNFDGSTTQITNATLNGFLFSNFCSAATCTISVWVKPTGAGPGNFGNAGNGTGIFVASANDFGVARSNVGSGDQMCGYNNDGSEEHVCTNTVVDRWAHLVLVHAGGDIYFYVNGALIAATATGDTVHPNNSMAIGVAIRYFHGAIDDVRIYNRALTQGEVAQLYHLGTANVAHSNSGLISNGLVGYWPLDGNTTNWTTNTTADVSGSGNAGTLVSMSTSSSPIIGKIGQALNFNGASSYIYTTTSYASPGPQVFSVSIWFKTSVASGHKLIGFENVQSVITGSTYDRHIYMGTDGKIYFGVHNVASYTVASSATLTDNKWHIAVGTFDGSTMKLYIDGVYQGSNNPGAAQAYTGYWRIGNYKLSSWSNASDGYYQGQLDDVRIYNRALTQGEVQQLYTAGK